ncbi:uncharacterized protein TM35_000024110 [Trypanosoma theileri]|uniref:Uncharacterized protein n=1 Tax=Trypanosoma theileri TaxID=67003 RepID=A0A1X0P8C2_9TRYP|nr:uncharacterized protein TM35_000024110 [Trypanosoma theileri]ORC93085.1 hypothetical protein TM35_000024110 [Trypanosoma theileri]
MKTNGLLENRALLQVLTHAENTSRTPIDILKGAVAGGVVVSFIDEKNRYPDTVLMPSSSDLATLAILITEGLFVPSLHRVVGDQLSRYTVVGESGCFESLAIPVLLFPDCFAVPSACESTPQSTPSRPLLSPGTVTATGVTNTSLDSHSSQTGVSAASVDIYQLHKLRSNVGILLLKSVNEVLQDAEVWKLKASRTKNTTGKDTSTEVAAMNAVIALFYEIKILLLCCILSSDRAYKEENNDENDFTLASSCFSELFPPDELFRIFEHESRPSADDVVKWYDVMLKNITNSAQTLTNAKLQNLVMELQQETVADGVRVNGLPIQLLHRPHDTTSSTFFQISLPHIELPHLETQPGEMVYLFGDPGEQPLLFDTNPSKIFFLLRRSATTKLTSMQIRDVDKMFASAPWQNLRDVLVQTMAYYLSDDQFICSVLEKNSSLMVKLIQWLHKDVSEADKEENNKNETSEEREEKEKNLDERKKMGLLMTANIMNAAVHIAPFSAGVAQFMREMLDCGLLTADHLNPWVKHSVADLEGKSSATVGLFAIIVTFALIHRGWELEENAREETIKLCTQHRQQQNCLTLLNLLRR